MASLGHDEQYYTIRNIHLDQRGTLLIDAGSHWGFYITVFTQSHSTRDWKEIGFKSVTLDRPVVVERGAWIGSNSVLYNCKIGGRRNCGNRLSRAVARGQAVRHGGRQSGAGGSTLR